MQQIWNIFSDLIGELVNEFGFQIHAFVLMSNHFHALATTPIQNLDEIMLHWLREGARRINREAGRINHIFGGPYKWSVISNSRYYEHALRYVYQNPVKAGIVDRVEKYPYSTLHFLHKNMQLRFPLSESIFDRQSVMDLALWQKLDLLNTRFDSEQNDSIQRALRHSVFGFHKHRMTGKLPFEILEQLELSSVNRTESS